MVDGTAEKPTPKELWADIGDLKVRYLDWGGDGKPLLALHGLASSAHWYDIVAPLLRDRYHLDAPDQFERGHIKDVDVSAISIRNPKLPAFFGEKCGRRCDSQ